MATKEAVAQLAMLPERVAIVETKVHAIEEKIDDLKCDVKDMHDCLDNTRDLLDKKLSEMSEASNSQHTDLANKIKEQLLGMRDTYFPKLGDKPAAIQAKKQRLETLIDSAYISSGRATPPRTSLPYTAPVTQPNINQQLNVPTINAPKFLGFENANR